MNRKEFFDSVCELRRWQKEYDKTRRTEAGRKVKKLEQEVDAEIARVCAILGTAAKQPNIFDK
ncbi:hypothetical protein [Alloprevotella tannerae]|uniref:hypothetical protein n=1 Tax=Alloprevotella tannerae TaxID=76122 RepID=UPI0028EE7A81|nr:hypothetical protein [Alloprevotella tannerae]